MHQICAEFLRDCGFRGFFCGFMLSVLFVQTKDWGQSRVARAPGAPYLWFFRECSRFFCDFVFSVLFAKSVLFFSDCLIRFSVASRGILQCGMGWGKFVVSARWTRLETQNGLVQFLMEVG